MGWTSSLKVRNNSDMIRTRNLSPGARCFNDYPTVACIDPAAADTCRASRNHRCHRHFFGASLHTVHRTTYPTRKHLLPTRSVSDGRPRTRTSAQETAPRLSLSWEHLHNAGSCSRETLWKPDPWSTEPEVSTSIIRLDRQYTPRELFTFMILLALAYAPGTRVRVSACVRMYTYKCGCVYICVWRLLMNPNGIRMQPVNCQRINIRNGMPNIWLFKCWHIANIVITRRVIAGQRGSIVVWTNLQLTRRLPFLFHIRLH